MATISCQQVSFAACLFLNLLHVPFVQATGETENDQPELNLSPELFVNHRIDLSFEVDSVDKLSETVQLLLPLTGPVTVTGDFSFTKVGYVITSLILKSGENNITGDVFVSFAGNRPALEMTLNTSRIDFTEQHGDEIEEQNNNEKVFPAELLNLEVIKRFNLKLNFNIDQLIIPGFVFEQLQITANIVDGLLELTATSPDVAKGRFNTVLKLDTNTPITEIVVNLKISQFVPGELPGLKELYAIEGAHTDIDMEVKGTGHSMAEIMGTLNGHFLMQTGNGKLLTRQIDLIGADILLNVLNMINPFRKINTETELLCSVIKFDINGGIATSDEGMAMLTNKMKVLGSGIIDFKTESLDLAFHPESLSKNMPVKFGSLAELVRVKGSFANPEVEASTRVALKLARAAGAAGAAVLTGGLSILAQGLFSKLKKTDNPCETVFEK